MVQALRVCYVFITIASFSSQWTQVRSAVISGGPSPREGWVQINTNGRWMYVCGRDFGEEEANVVCRGKGYPTRNTTFQSLYKYASGPVAHIACSGGEPDLHYCNVREDYYGYSCNQYHAWVECENTIRLVNGTDMYSGRVEVYYRGQWGTVCDDEFDNDDALVICRMLNMTDSDSYVATYQNAHYGRGQGQIIVDNLECRGYEEDIRDCRSNPWLTHNCGHHEDAGIDCKDLAVRLVNGFDGDSGRVEIRHEGIWYTVCDRYFGHDEAKVICKQLGKYYGEMYGEILTSDRFGRRDYGSSLDQIQCKGYEQNITECEFGGWQANQCSHSDDVGIHCSGYYVEHTTDTYAFTTPSYVSAVRLTGGHQGIVEVYANGRWGTVCSYNFGRDEADLICRSLGYPTDSVITSSGYYGTNVALSYLNCYGGETSINQCYFQEGYSYTYCSGNNRAWVGCQNKIRLVDGPDIYSGRVEVYYHGQWGTVCDDSFDRDDALVICRMLNITDSYSDVVAYGQAHYGPGSGPTIIDELRCNGYESDIANCSSNRWLVEDCSHSEDAGVDCRDLAVRLVNGFDGDSGRVEIRYNGTWHSVCDRYFGHDEAKVICKQLGKYYGEMYGNIFTSSRFGRGHGSSLDQIQCNGYEQNITECYFDGWQVNQCSHSNDVGIHCSGYYVEHTTYAYAVTTRSYVSAVRLTDGHQGIVEVYANGRWGTVCSYNFHRDEADLICRSLGYPTTSVSYSSGYYGTNVALSYMNCYGGETDINQCYLYEGYNYRYCSGNSRAWVGCQNKIRLVDGPDIYSGRVEVYYHGQWGTVCDDSFDRDDALVICRMLNITDSYSDVVAYGQAHYGPGSGRTIIDELRCNGYESDIVNCSSNRWLVEDCTHNEDAGVDCRAWQHTTESVVTEVTDQGIPVRLVNGSDNFSGRLEIYRHGAWRSVCRLDFGHNEAKVICRQLGIFYGDNYGQIYNSYRYGQGQLSSIRQMRCYGYEYDISGCYRFDWSTGSCSHYYDVGINCRGWAPQTTQWYHKSTVPSVPSVSSTVSVSCDENGWQIDLDLHRLQQIYPSAIASDIYLGENSCTGMEYYGRLRFRQGLRECLTNEIMRNDVLVYKNELIYAQHDRNHPFIIKSFNWTVPVECDVERNATSHGHLHHIDHSVTAEPPVVGHSEYSVNMTFYQDPNFAYEIRGNPLQVQVGSEVYVKVFTQTSDWNVKLRVHTCYTKPSEGAPNHMKYYIIKNGCEVDSNTHLLQQHAHETRFVFQDFEYTTNHEGIYLYCDATFCDPNDYSSSCSQTCHSVVKRNAHIEKP